MRVVHRAPDIVTAPTELLYNLVKVTVEQVDIIEEHTIGSRRRALESDRPDSAGSVRPNLTAPSDDDPQSALPHRHVRPVGTLTPGIQSFSRLLGRHPESQPAAECAFKTISDKVHTRNLLKGSAVPTGVY
jgi:hypothetical protein